MPEYLETTADKFTFRVAIDRLSTPNGKGVKPDFATKRVRMGLADYRQQHTEEAAFASVKPARTQALAGALVAEIETVKADTRGFGGVLTPENSFVAAADTCIRMIFIWATERFKLKLLSYEGRAEETKLNELDGTGKFTRLTFQPRIWISAAGEVRATIDAHFKRALQASQKHSLVANSVK